MTAARPADTLIASYNDLDSVHRLFDAHRDQIAALIVEPIAGNMGVVPPSDGFLRALREATKAHRALLIFDEVISGFRAAPGGAQALFGVRPDLTCLGKIIGGGLPVGAYGGRADLMELVSPAGPVYQAGTLSGNPLAMAAGIWCLDRLEPRLYQQLRALGTRLAGGLADAAREAGVAVQVNAFGSLLTPFFTDRPVRDYRSGHERQHGALREVLPRHADARDLSAAVAIRGVVPVGGAHGEGRRQDGRRRARGDEGSGEGMSQPPLPALPGYWKRSEDRQHAVNMLFDRSAAQYDWICNVTSFGTGQAYRREALVRAGLRRGMTVLDVGTGTGLVAREAVRLLQADGRVIGVDPSTHMMAAGAPASRYRSFKASAKDCPFRMAGSTS